MQDNATNAVTPAPQAQPQINPVPSQGQTTETSKKAGFIVRAGAYFVDTLILGIFGIFINILFLKSNTIIQSVLGLLPLLYFWVATGLYGTTLGKKFYHLRVERTDGAKVGLGKAFLREIIGKILSSIVFSLGYFWVIWDKDKQGWHDKIGKTYVIQDSPVGKFKMFLAYFIILLGPIFFVLGILGAIVLTSINPTKQLEKARQQQLQYEQQQQILPDIQPQTLEN